MISPRALIEGRTLTGVRLWLVGAIGDIMSDKPLAEQVPHEILLNPDHKEIHAAVGRAIDAYSHVEGSETFLLKTLLGTSPAMAGVVFNAVQNVHSRHEMIESMLELKHGEKYKAFWNACETFLTKLSKFRNALVHWQPTVAIYQDKSDKVIGDSHELTHPSPTTDFLPIAIGHIEPFIGDCRYIEQELFALDRALNDPTPAALPDKFLKPAIHANEALLRLRPMPKAPQPQRQPSQASESQKSKNLAAKQRRTRALKMAEKKRRRTDA